MYDALDTLMKQLEKWRVKQVMAICADPQVAAFHLTALTEEKFRVRYLSHTPPPSPSFALHVQARDNVFALEWALRALALPYAEPTLIQRVRDSWRKAIADKALRVLDNLADYSAIRELVICAKRGGYLIDTPAPNVYHFRDSPDWPGARDIKSRLVGEAISADRDLPVANITPETINLDATSAYEDFPHDVHGSSYTGSDFWHLWKHILQMCVNHLIEDCTIRNHESFAATSETKELGILVTKRKLIESIVTSTALPIETVSMFLRWMTLNAHTPRKFAFFHCPLVEVNEKFFLIAPHVVLLAHPPTIFLRLLAHYDKAAYDACSSDMEKRLLRRLKTHMEGPNRIVSTNVKLHTPDGEMELDMVEYDRSEATLSIGQAKFTIRPDSPSEVDHTNAVIKQGMDQLKRDRLLLSKNPDNIKRLLAQLGAEGDQVTEIKYFLLPTRFTGSDFLNMPSWIMPLPIEFCLRPQCKGQAFSSVWAEYEKLWDSLDEKVTSAKSEQEFEIGGFKVVCPGFSM